MFKEIVNDVIKLFTPVSVQLPDGFTNGKPYDIMSTFISRFGLSRDIDNFTRFVISKDEDLIYASYKGLNKDYHITTSSDVLICRGKPALITLIDYDIATSSDIIGMKSIMIIIEETVNFLKAKNAGLFYKTSEALRVLFSYAVPMLFIDITLKTFQDTDTVRENMVSILQKHDSSFDREELDSYIEMLTAPSTDIEFLLDWSAVSAMVAAKK